MQQNKLEQLEKARDLNATALQQTAANKTIEMANCATQTERVSRLIVKPFQLNSFRIFSFLSLV
jgi:hypothetical protein